jgi:aspartate aminotransferase-like enzyme
MPYIELEKRIKYDKILTQMDVFTIENKGELEYCIFKLMQMYMRKKEFKYSNLHDTVYAAQHCADEYRRRFLDKREDDARENNGDVVAGIHQNIIALMLAEEDKKEDITNITL